MCRHDARVVEPVTDNREADAVAFLLARADGSHDATIVGDLANSGYSHLWNEKDCIGAG